MALRDLLAAGIEYQARGWRVFVVKGKRPRPGSHGCKDATTDRDELERMLSSWPEADGIAIATGGGLVVVDVDATDHEILEHVPLDYVVRTPRGGWHVYLSSTRARNSTGRLASHVDTRGEGGYVVAPPSPGYTLGASGPLPDAPSWLVDEIASWDAPVRYQHPVIDMLSPSSGVGYGRKILLEECAKVASAKEGQRNSTLNEATFRVFRRVAAGEIARSEAEADLLAAALACGLDEREAIATIKSGARGGEQHAAPRPVRAPASVVVGGLYDAGIDVSGIEDVPAVLDERAVDDAETVTRDELVESALESVTALGGLCASYPSWILSTSEYPQPGLALASTIALGSVLGARRLVVGGLTTSLLVVSVSLTGSGKSRPQSALREVLRSAWGDLLGPSDVTSTRQVIKDVGDRASKGHGVAMILDEYGAQLKAMMAERAVHKSDLRHVLLTMSTTNAGTYTASSSVTSGRDARDIYAPGLTIFGSSTPSALRDVVSRASVEDGLTGRHLWIPGSSTLPYARDVMPTSAPQAVVDGVRAIRAHHAEWWSSLVTSETDDKTGAPIYLYAPQIVDVTPTARTLWSEYRDEVDEERRSSTSTMPVEVLARAAEQARRVSAILALLARPGVDVDVRAEEMAAAIQIARLSVATIGEVISEHAAESQHERAQKRIRATIARHAGADGWVSRRQIMLGCRALTPRELADALAHLQQIGEVEVQEIAPPKGGHATFRARLR